MKPRFLTNAMHGVCGGSLLYILASVRSLLVYVPSKSMCFDIVFIFITALCVFITFFSLVHKHYAPCYTICRAILLHASFWGGFLLDALIGITRCIKDSLCVQSSSVADNLSGLFVLTFSILVSIVCICVIGFMSTHHILIRLINKHKRSRN